MKLGRYLHLARTLPPRQLIAKGAGLLVRPISSPLRSWQARLFGTELSDTALQAALLPELSGRHDLLRHLRSGSKPTFFVQPTQGASLTAALRRHFPEAEAATVAAADRACAHVFDLLGSGPTALGEMIDWHLDFKSGRRYDPRAYYTGLRPTAYPGGHDIKVPWELSRCQHFVWLGQAYWYTGDEKYAREFVAQVADWIEKNPPRFGVNWTTTMDVAIRAVNWLWGFYFFKRSPSLTDDFLWAFNKSLLAHGRHIRSNLEWSDELTANHYLADIVGLVYLGILCPQFGEAEGWREFGLRELWREMGKQVYDDGVDFEASISYHRLAAELFLSPVILCQLNNIKVPEEVLARLEKMLEFTMHYTRPDGTAPLIGDCDNGRLHRLKAWADAEKDREWTDHRYLLAVGAVLFERDDFGQVAGDQWQEAFWLLDLRAAAFKEALDGKNLPATALNSRGFQDGGIYIMRRANAYLIVDAGPNGQNGIGGHAHNDTLSFELFAGGRPWIIDPGAYVYTLDYEARNLFRSSAYHNVLVVDDREINDIPPSLLFHLSNDAAPRASLWETSADRDLLVASHNGYQRLKPPVAVERSFLFDKRITAWLVRDDIRGGGAHTFKAFFHFAPCEIEMDGHLLWAASYADDEALAIAFLQASPDMIVSQTPGWISSSYGCRTPAPVISLAGTFRDRLQQAYFFWPCRRSERPPAERVMAAGGDLLERLSRRHS